MCHTFPCNISHITYSCSKLYHFWQNYFDMYEIFRVKIKNHPFIRILGGPQDCFRCFIGIFISLLLKWKFGRVPSIYVALGCHVFSKIGKDQVWTDNPRKLLGNRHTTPPPFFFPPSTFYLCFRLFFFAHLCFIFAPSTGSLLRCIRDVKNKEMWIDLKKFC